MLRGVSAGSGLLEPDLRTSRLRPEPSAQRAGQRLTSPLGGRSCDIAAYHVVGVACTMKCSVQSVLRPPEVRRCPLPSRVAARVASPSPIQGPCNVSIKPHLALAHGSDDCREGWFHPRLRPSRFFRIAGNEKVALALSRRIFHP